jgi:hypothetical protein
MTDAPDWTDYWSKVRFYYFHDDAGAWGVRDAEGDHGIVIDGLDKNIAAVIACLHNGDIAHAIDVLRGL